MATAGGKALALSFAGSGFIGVYHLGAITCLEQHGHAWLQGVEKFAGASAGALVAAVMAVGTDTISISSCMEHVLSMAKDTRKRALGAFTPGTNILIPMAEYIRKHIPENGHEIVSGRLYVSVTNMTTRKNELVSQFDTREDLIQYLLASCYIPGFGGYEAPSVNSQKYLDGGITMNMPLLSSDHCRTVCISPFCGRLDICPLDTKSLGPFLNVGGHDMQMSAVNISRMVHALFPPSTEEMHRYFERGYKDAKRFLIMENALDDDT